MTPVKITAELCSPICGQLGPLDGVLAWAYVQRALRRGDFIPPLTDDYCHDMTLPLARWEMHGAWGWKVSDVTVDERVAHSSIEIRRKPATTAMAVLTSSKDHHHGLGPMKARNAVLATQWSLQCHWWAVSTDVAELEETLLMITHVGSRTRNGFGRVTSWSITEDNDATQKWQERFLPTSGPHGELKRVRAPYWHPTERFLCTWGGDNAGKRL